MPARPTLTLEPLCALLVILAGCGPSVGSPCGADTGVECGDDMFCDFGDGCDAP